ncbi:hypothetical protein N2152v2_007644 [Parachlorella kessleri]
MRVALGGAHKAAAHKATAAPQPPASQLGKGPGTPQDASAAGPSFAASAVVGRPSTGRQNTSGLIGRLLDRLRPAAPTLASDALPGAPSFAAAPLTRGQPPRKPASETAPAQPNAVLETARRLAAQASASSAVSPATARNPLYRLAKLGQGRQEDAAAKARASSNKENLGALKQYAELPQKARTAPSNASRAAKRALNAKALLRYAKLK